MLHTVPSCKVPARGRSYRTPRYTYRSHSKTLGFISSSAPSHPYTTNRSDPTERQCTRTLFLMLVLSLPTPPSTAPVGRARRVGSVFQASPLYGARKQPSRVGNLVLRFQCFLCLLACLLACYVVVGYAKAPKGTYTVVVGMRLRSRGVPLSSAGKLCPGLPFPDAALASPPGLGLACSPPLAL